MKPKTKKKKDGGPPDKILRFTQLGFQMALIIGLSSWGGVWLDDYFQSNTPWWTIGLSLFGVFTSLYVVFKEIQQMNS
jgi:cation diffusion facilitator CzcD-associated flavoprotein CzcO